jgi:hypothetical protein
MENIEAIQESTLKSALRTIENLMATNRGLQDEIQKLRPLARLAEVIALMEGSNHRQHNELIEADRKYEDLHHKYMELLNHSNELLEHKVNGNGAAESA